jgi:branched-chain amino acid transport system permease protein
VCPAPAFQRRENSQYVINARGGGPVFSVPPPGCANGSRPARLQRRNCALAGDLPGNKSVARVQRFMEQFLQQLLNGLAVGGIYALVALGYTMVYGVLKLINFAHGDLFTIGAYLGLTLLVSCNFSGMLSPMLAVLAVFVMVALLVAIIGFLLERTAYRPLRNANRLSAVVSALGASIFFQNAIMLIYGARFYVYPDYLRPDFTVHLFGLAVPGVRLLVIAASVILMLGLWAFIQRSRTGAAIRAVAIDPGAAQLMGINVDRIISLVFLIGPGLGGAAGLMVGIYYGQIDFTMGWTYGLKAFTAAILGGIGNIPGAMIGGLLLGVIEALAAGYIAIAWKDAIAFFVLILILIIRPTGILGERTADKL